MADEGNFFAQFETPPQPQSQRPNFFERFEKGAIDTDPVNPETVPPVDTGTQMLRGVLDAPVAAMQGVSPAVTVGAGKYNYTRAPEESQAIFAETGQPQNAQTEVVLRDPQSGKYSVFMRNPEMEEGRIAGLGRVVSPSVLPGSVPSAALPLSKAQSLLRDYETAQVPASVPAIGQGIGSRLATNIASKLPGIGGPIAKGATGTMEAEAAAAERMASGYGDAVGAEAAGRSAQSGIEGFRAGEPPVGLTPNEIISAPTRATSFQAKAGALFDRYRNLVDETTQVPLDNTLDALRGPMDRFPSNPALGEQITNPKLRSLFETVAPSTEEIPAIFSKVLDVQGNPILLQAAQKVESGGSLTSGELGELRSTIGRMLSEPMMVDNIPRADLKRVYGAISQDIENAAASTGPEALRAFQRANTYYKAGIDRLDRLEPILTVPSPEAAFKLINSAASETGRTNAGLLRSLQRSMPAEDWGNVGAAVIRRLGETTPGAKNLLHEAHDFSASSFATNWNKLTDAAKDTLFGASVPGSNRESLDALARVAASQKNIAKFANPSGSASHLIGGGLAFAALEHWEQIAAHPMAAISGVLGGYGFSKALMSPGFARLLYQAPSLAKDGAAGASRFLSAVDQIARVDPSFSPIETRLWDVLGGQSNEIRRRPVGP